MAGGSLLLLLDDIAYVLDDVATLTKVAGKKTAGVLGDDIALNAQQVGGVVSNRELPVVWAVAKGSFRNKLILVPAALAISAFIPAAITPLLMLGGLYLCFEGAEKIIHSLFHTKHEPERAEPPIKKVDEKQKIQGAIRTDFILSAEIIAISLGTVAVAPFATQAMVVSVIALIMTVGVYGFVAAVVRMDDFGFALSQRSGALAPALGRGILATAPYLMKGLSIVGTAAMFLVGGGILAHGIPRLEHLSATWTLQSDAHVGLFEAIIGGLAPILFNGLVGAVAGLVVFGAVTLIKRFMGRA